MQSDGSYPQAPGGAGPSRYTVPCPGAERSYRPSRWENLIPRRASFATDRGSSPPDSDCCEPFGLEWSYATKRTELPERCQQGAQAARLAKLTGASALAG